MNAPTVSPFPSFYLVTPWFGTFAGGGGRTFTALAEMFTRCGLDTTVLTTCSKSPYQDWRSVTLPPGESSLSGVKVLRFPVDQSNADPYHAAVSARIKGQPVSEDLQNAFFELGLNSKDLSRYVSQLPSEAVVIAGHYFQSLVPSVINANPGRVVALPAFHDEPEFYWAPIGRLVKNARQILFISEEEKDLAIRAYGLTAGRKLIEAPVVGLGVELTKETDGALQDKTSLARSLSRFNLPPEYLVYVGRIELGKGLSYLMPWIMAFNEKRVALGKSPIPLVLIGEGPAGVVPDSEFLMPVGYLSEEEKAAVIRHASGLINPSTLESFSYVVMEAWLAGTPVLVPAACAVTSGHVARCGGGMVFQDEMDFRAKVELLMQQDRRNTLAQSGRQYVRRNFRWPDVLDRILRAVLQ
jgi:glycosyltransferase involved in cell wall biosynthesis